MDTLVVRSRSFSDELNRAAVEVEDAAWSRLGFLNFTVPHRAFYDDLLTYYADLQLCLVDRETDYPVALLNCVPIPYVDPLELPQEGWDWLVETAANSKSEKAELLGALAISVPDNHRQKGYARQMIRALRELAETRGFGGVVAPVRPSAKADHPNVPMGEYLSWKNEQGAVFDPWLRTHVSEGGKLIRSCEKSMVVEEHVAFWETWAGRRLEHSGRHLIEGALCPIFVDLETQIGRYEEPNVWMAYSLS